MGNTDSKKPQPRRTSSQIGSPVQLDIPALRPTPSVSRPAPPPPKDGFQSGGQRLTSKRYEGSPRMGHRASVTAVQQSTTGLSRSAATSSALERAQPLQKPQQEAGPAVPPPSGDDIFAAMYDYTARTANEMSFTKGETLRVKVIEGQNWWEAESLSTGHTGWIPSNYVGKKPITERWYHGPITRVHAEYLLISGIDGSFLVRESESTPGDHSISLRFERKVYHYRIGKCDLGLYISKESPFATLKELVGYHATNSDGLVCPLKVAVAAKGAAPVFGVSREVDDKWEVERTEIQLGTKLGAGQYGEVYEGYWTIHHRTVAVKTFKAETMSPEEFLKEAAVMKQIQHPSLVQLLGVCTREQPLFIITEFLKRGNLLDFLRSDEGRTEIDPTTMMYIATQAVSGMAYLESRCFIHRDLAARNCLVGDHMVIKVADFGLSRLLKAGSEQVYAARDGAKFPIKWTAPEALSYNRFTTKSDVWAFGILLWELCTYGKSPYPGIDLFSVLERLETGYRMPRPEACPPDVYQVMTKCWHMDPEARPSFAELKIELDHMFEGSSADEAVAKTATSDRLSREFYPHDESDIHDQQVHRSQEHVHQQPLQQRTRDDQEHLQQHHLWDQDQSKHLQHQQQYGKQQSQPLSPHDSLLQSHQSQEHVHQQPLQQRTRDDQEHLQQHHLWDQDQSKHLQHQQQYGKQQSQPLSPHDSLLQSHQSQQHHHLFHQQQQQQQWEHYVHASFQQQPSQTQPQQVFQLQQQQQQPQQQQRDHGQQLQQHGLLQSQKAQPPHQPPCQPSVEQHVPQQQLSTPAQPQQSPHAPFGREGSTRPKPPPPPVPPSRAASTRPKPPAPPTGNQSAKDAK